MAVADTRFQRWLVYPTRSLLIIVDHPRLRGGAQDQVEFLGISRDGVAREGSDTQEGFKAKLASFHPTGEKPRPLACVAILGCLTANQEHFLMLVTDAAVAAEVEGHSILEITRCEPIPFSSSLDPNGEAATAVGGVRQMLERQFYFSHDMSVTQRLQQRLREGSDGQAPSVHREGDRFIWNRQMAEPLLQQGVSPRWFTPVMQGFVQSREAPGLQLLLVARRSSRRAGTRYNARGLDDDGEVGNWVETEQLVRISQSDGSPRWLGFVQVRGSAPIFWEQPSAMSGVHITRSADLGAVAFENHRSWIQAEYGQTLYVSLLSSAIGKRETEGTLIAALEEQARRQKSTEMLHLDFHARVTGHDKAFDQELDVLAGGTSDQVALFGYLDTAGKATWPLPAPARLQTGVVRTNCFDCLDRTNTFQYQLVWRWLRQCSREIPELKGLASKLGHAPVARQNSQGSAGIVGVFGALGDVLHGETAPGNAAHPPLQVALRGLWADLGDALSEQYTGAASTMAAALRQGGRTALSVLEKGWHSVNRAYCARFEDGARQAALDLLLGKHRLPRAPSTPEVRRAPCGQLTVAALTWNLHGVRCWESPGAMQTLLHGCVGASANPIDMVIFSFQEFLELSAANVVMQANGDEVQQAEFEKCATQAFPAVFRESFVKVQSVGMVGLYVCVFVAERLRSSVSAVAADRVRSGLYGQAGNKGAVAVRLDVAKTSICAFSLHLESGQGKAAERASQLREVMQNCFASVPGKFNKSVTKHDLVLCVGDFNFRMAIPENSDTEALRATLQKGWPSAVPNGDPGCIGEGVSSAALVGQDLVGTFNEYDELKGSRGHSELKDLLREFGLMEGPVLFPATFKMFEGQQVYDAERVPAWCDRVLHSKVAVVRRRYCALAGLMQSDHRPVCVVLETQLLAMPTNSSAASRPPQQRQTHQQQTASAVSAPQRQEVQQQQQLQQQSQPVQAPQLAQQTSRGGAAAGDLLSLQEEEDHCRSKIGATDAAAATPIAGTEDLLDFLGSSADPVASPEAVKSKPPAPITSPTAAAPAPQAAQTLQSTVQGGSSPVTAGSPSLVPGQLVLAEYAGGWYYANVLQVKSSTCDVAWLRPQAVHWGSGATMSRYLCSTGADETQHGDGLPIATKIRLPDDGRPKAASPGGTAGSESADFVDLLG